ncbi:MAG TPA: roadblock/LC7 domain-containing protein [Gaiellaceae bacterium]|nr:roadblock/LC7 domain-containing protein [Gaiellaceae bacterium]
MAQTPDALRELTEISTQIEAAVVLDREGAVVASTLDDERAGRLAGAALELLGAAEEQGESLVQLDVALRDGVVFLVADGDRVITATTGPEPTAGLVFYDLKSCLRALAGEEKPKAAAKPRARRAPAKKTSTRKKADDAGT